MFNREVPAADSYAREIRENYAQYTGWGIVIDDNLGVELYNRYLEQIGKLPKGNSCKFTGNVIVGDTEPLENDRERVLLEVTGGGKQKAFIKALHLQRDKNHFIPPDDIDIEDENINPENPTDSEKWEDTDIEL